MKKLLLFICLLPNLYAFAGDSVSVNEMNMKLMQKEVDSEKDQLDEKKKEVETLMQQYEEGIDKRLQIYTAIFVGVLGLASWALNYFGKDWLTRAISNTVNIHVDEVLKNKLTEEFIDKKIKAIASPLIIEKVGPLTSEIIKIKENVREQDEILKGLDAHYNGNFEESINSLKTNGTNSNAKNSFILSTRGLNKKKLGRYEDAIKDYDEAIRLSPTFVIGYINRGASKNDLGRYEDAIKDFNEAIRLDPNKENAFTNRGVSKIYLGRYEDAIRDFDEAIRLNQTIANPHKHKAHSLMKLGRLQEALEEVNIALQLKPNYKDAIDLKAEIGM